MPKLAGHSCCSAENFILMDNSATDTGTEGNHYEIIEILACTKSCRTESREVGIIFYHRIQSGSFLKLFRNPFNLPSGQVGGEFNNLSIHTYHSRTAHTDTDRLDPKSTRLNSSHVASSYAG